MTRKTIRELDSEFSSFKEEFLDAKAKLASLLQLVQKLQENSNYEKTNGNIRFKCDKCENDFETLSLMLSSNFCTCVL